MINSIKANQTANYPSPFDQGKYSGNINVIILQDTKTSAFFIKVVGERISLETVQGEHYDEFKGLFGDLVQKNTSEFEDFKEIFGDAISRKDYADGQAQSDKKVYKRLELNSKRPLSGNPFTGFSVVENSTRKIIGFASLGCGYLPGESQSGLILNKDFQNMEYGSETALLLGALAHIYYINKFEVGPKNCKESIKAFSASVKDSDSESIAFIQKFGLHLIRPLRIYETYTQLPSSLYGVDAQDFQKYLEKFISLNQVTWEFAKK